MKRPTTFGLLFCVSFTVALFASLSPLQLLIRGQVDIAVPDLEQHLSQSPKDASSYNLLCRAYLMMEEWDRGISNCERAADLDPQSSTYQLWLGRVYGEKADRSSFVSAPGLAKKSRAAFEKAVELDPKNIEARMDLGEFYAEAPGFIGGGKDKARQQAQALLSLDPAIGHWVLARIAEKEKDPAKAESEYRAEIDASHGAVRGWVDLGNFLLYAHRYDEMNQALAHTETAPIDHPESLMHAGNLLLRSQQNYPLAVRLLQRYLSNRLCEEGPAFKAHTILGEVLVKQGDKAGAAQEFRAALALYGNYTRAKEDLKKIEH